MTSLPQHFAFLLAVFLVFAALGILAVTSQATLISDVEGRLQKRLREGYNQTGQGIFTVAIDFVQVEVSGRGSEDGGFESRRGQMNGWSFSSPEAHLLQNECVVC